MRVVAVDTMAIGFMVVGSLGFAVEAGGWCEGFVVDVAFAIDARGWRANS